MAASVNRVILMGHCGADVELKYTQQGVAFTKFSIATSEYAGKDKEGKPMYKPEWHNITAFGKPAETAGKHLKQGSLCHIQGKKTDASWNDKDGKKHDRCEILADEILPINRAAAPQEHESGNYDSYGVPRF